MSFRMRKVQVWSGEIPDRAGAAAAKLHLLAEAKADLEFIFTKPAPGKPETSTIFLAPITGPDQAKAAQEVGLGPARDMVMLCLEGENRPGLGYQIMSRLAVAGINLRGLSLSSVDQKFAAYLAFDNADVATQAIQVLATIAA